MAEIKPFRALRYDESKAGPLANLVAPPYDVISPAERDELLARSPFNVVHLTLPDSQVEAGETFASWRRDGVLVEDEAPAAWVLSQDYAGPDGVRRTRSGIVAALRVETYEKRIVLPHERTHRGPKEGRLRLLRATRAQLEPILCLHEGPPVELPSRDPDVVVDGTRLWRDDSPALEGFADRQLLIADGHHRYETALAFHEEAGSQESAYTLAALVSTAEEGLTIFPTHRLAGAFKPSNSLLQSPKDPRELLRDLDGVEGAAVVVYTPAGASVVRGDGLDTEIVEQLGPEDVSYTASLDEAIAAVDERRVAAAFLLRPTPLETVWAAAREGDTMPQKTTYFYPKLVSGLLFLRL